MTTICKSNRFQSLGPASRDLHAWTTCQFWTNQASHQKYTLVLSSHFLRHEKLATFRLLITHHFSFSRVLQAHENEQLWRWISLQRKLTITDSMARDRQATSLRHPYCWLWVHSIQSSCLGGHCSTQATHRLRASWFQCKNFSTTALAWLGTVAVDIF
jgi:hypothetical protein